MKTWKPIAAGSALGLAVAGVLTLSPAFAQTAPSHVNSGPVVAGEIPTGQNPSTGTPTVTLPTATVEPNTNNGPSATVATDRDEQNGETQVNDGDLDNSQVGEEGQHGESVNENVDDQSKHQNDDAAKNPSTGSPGTAGANSNQHNGPSTSDPATGSDSSGNTGNNGDSNS
jgi:hypothetical protein